MLGSKVTDGVHGEQPFHRDMGPTFIHSLADARTLVARSKSWFLWITGPFEDAARPRMVGFSA